MTRRMAIISVAAAVLMITASAFSAAAANRAGTFTLTPNVGGFAFDTDLDLEDEITYGLGFGYNYTDRFGVEAAFNYVDTEVDGSSEDVEGYFYRIDWLYHFFPEEPVVPYVAAGLGAFTFDPDDSGSETEFAGNYGLGLKFFLSDAIALRADARHVMTFPENSFLYTAGLTFYFGGEEEEPAEPVAAPVAAPADSDGDGVPDDRDECPGTPAGVLVDASGCAADSDGDGVADTRDECPNTPAGAEVDSRGCPLDSDNDGVIDLNDRCPDTPAGATVDRNGCPQDSDNDGVPDADDECPRTAAGITVDERGCPLDSDNDGIPDVNDRCPGTPEGANVNIRGCWVIKDLRFDVDKSEIKSQYYDNLANVVTVLKQNPDMEVEIQGYTDSQGPEEYNQKLSERRARAVVEFLTENGIDPDRLTYRGYGESDPVATNETAEGRARNRRVEIKPNY